MPCLKQWKVQKGCSGTKRDQIALSIYRICKPIIIERQSQDSSARAAAQAMRWGADKREQREEGSETWEGSETFRDCKACARARDSDATLHRWGWSIWRRRSKHGRSKGSLVLKRGRIRYYEWRWSKWCRKCSVHQRRFWVAIICVNRLSSNHFGKKDFGFDDRFIL